MMRGIRGAITVEDVTREEVIQATVELLEKILEQNDIVQDDLAAAIFSVTPDLQVAFPAEAARTLGWRHVPLLDCLEIGVPGALEKCIRVLVLTATEKKPQDMKHVYLRRAAALRPDLDMHEDK